MALARAKRSREDDPLAADAWGRAISGSRRASRRGPPGSGSGARGAGVEQAAAARAAAVAGPAIGPGWPMRAG